MQAEASCQRATATALEQYHDDMVKLHPTAASPTIKALDTALEQLEATHVRAIKTAVAAFERLAADAPDHSSLYHDRLRCVQLVPFMLGRSLHCAPLPAWWVAIRCTVSPYRQRHVVQHAAARNMCLSHNVPAEMLSGPFFQREFLQYTLACSAEASWRWSC